MDEFFKAVGTGKTKVVNDFLSTKKYHVDIKNEKGQTAIHIAILSNDLGVAATIEVIGILLSHGAKINLVDNNGNTPLHVSAKTWPTHIKLVKFLVEKGANIYKKNKNQNLPVESVEKRSEVAIWLALQHISNGDIKIVSNLLERKILVLGEYGDCNTSIHVAVLSKTMSVNKTKEMIEFLIGEGENIDEKDELENTSLHYAAGKFDSEDKLVKFLVVNKANVYAKNKNGKMPIELAKKDSKVALWLTGNEKNKNDFFNSVAKLNYEFIEEILHQHEWYINSQNEKGQTAIHIAVLSDLTLKATIEMIEVLLFFEADINLVDNEGNTPLHVAAKTYPNCIELVSFLVKKGAKVKIKNNQGEEPSNLAPAGTAVANWFEKQDKILQRQLDTERHFFNFQRLKPEKKESLTPYKDKYIAGYKFFDPKFYPRINITGMSGRQLIIVETQALSEMTGGYCPPYKQQLLTTFAEKGWAVGSQEKYGIYPGGSEILERDAKCSQDGDYTITISTQHNPTKHQIGNVGVGNAVGAYGETITHNKYDGKIIKKGVLFAIYEVTKKDENSSSEKKCERNLAKLFLCCLKNGQAITTTLLEQHGLYYYKNMNDRKKVIQLLNEALVLTGIKEIVRHTHGSKVKLPLAIAYIQGLELIADGYLRMKDVFDEDAPYGIPTGAYLASSVVNREAAKEKLRSLNALYSETYSDNVPTAVEELHQFLLDKLGNDTDTDGEKYNEESIPRIKMN